MKFQQCFINSKGSIWRTQTLIEASKDLPIENYQVKRLPEATVIRWKLVNVHDYCVHYKRVMNADLSIPIILSPNGFIMDGYHRCIKAICEGIKVLPCRELIILPEPDFTE